MDLLEGVYEFILLTSGRNCECEERLLHPELEKVCFHLKFFFFFFPETLRSSNCHSIYSFFNLQLVPQCRLVLAFGEALI